MTVYQIVGASMLSALRPGHDYRPAVDEAYALGFNLLRTFCGALPWAGQELRHVYDRLPGYLDYLRAAGMHGYLSYCTEAGTGYDLDAHVGELERLTANRDNVLREVANEPAHPTQGGRLSPQRCLELAQRMAGPVSLGASTNDEATDYDGGHFCGPHLDRGRDKWNQVRRVREMETKPTACLNQEPIGAAEASEPGRRESDPSIFFTMGALNRLFSLGGIFHSQSGLDAVPLGPNQRQCAEAFLAGSRIWPGTDHLAYRNVGHDGSPVVAARFNEGRDEDGCTRAYSGVWGDTGLTVALGVVADPGLTWGNGWRPVEVLAGRPGVACWRVGR